MVKVKKYKRKKVLCKLCGNVKPYKSGLGKGCYDYEYGNRMAWKKKELAEAGFENFVEDLG